MRKVIIGIGVVCMAGSLAFLSGCAKKEKAPVEAPVEAAAEAVTDAAAAAPEVPAVSE